MRTAWLAFGTLMVAALAPGRLRAQTVPIIELSGGIAPVTISGADATWQSARLMAGAVHAGRFAALAGVERQARGGSVDWVYQATGHRRAGPWTFSGSVGYSSHPAFYYKGSAEAEIAYLVAHGVVVHAAYRHVAFPASNVELFQPAVSWYFRGGEIETRAFFVRNSADGRHGTTGLLRVGLDVSPRVRLVGAAAVGNRIFDIAALPGVGANAWLVSAGAALRVTPAWTLTATLGGAHESPSFSQRTLDMGLRWMPR